MGAATPWGWPRLLRKAAAPWYSIVMAHDWIVSLYSVSLRSVRWMMLVLLASACTGDDVADDAGGGTGSSGDTSSGADTADGESGDLGSTCASQTVPIDTLAAVLLVKVEILNDTAEPVYMADSAVDCTEFALARDGASLPLGPDFRCGCECPESSPPLVGVVAVQPGDSLVVYWDGRVRLYYEEFYYCEGDPSCSSDSKSAAQPLGPGSVTMTIPLYDEAGSFELSDSSRGSLCDSPRSFDVSFELGTEDLTVPVALSDVLGP